MGRVPSHSPKARLLRKAQHCFLDGIAYESLHLYFFGLHFCILPCPNSPLPELWVEETCQRTRPASKYWAFANKSSLLVAEPASYAVGRLSRPA